MDRPAAPSFLTVRDPTDKKNGGPGKTENTMAHPLELPAPIRNQLFTTAAGAITPALQLKTQSKVAIATGPDGVSTFSPNYWNVTWNDQHRLLANRPISISLRKPILPKDGTRENSITASEISVAFNNTDEHFATTQLGGILNPEYIEQTEIVLLANLGNSGIPFPMYRGTAVGLPEERAGETVLTFRNAMWNMITRPVLFERYGAGQVAQVNGGSYTFGTETVGAGQLVAFDAVVVFAEEGTPLTSATNSKPDDVSLQRVDIENGALPGQYTIEFTTATDYRITFPNNEFFFGTTAATFTGGNTGFGNTWGPWAVRILPGYWSAVGDPTGAKIEFYVSWVARGNPITLVKNLLEKALLENWGQVPTQPATLPIDWSAFDAVEAAFAGYTVHVDVTNPNNDVWERKKGNRPVNCLALAQQIADHVACQITLDTFGFVSITAPGVFEQGVYEISDGGNYPGIISHRILPQERFNFVQFRYGALSLSNNYSTVIPYDLRQAATDLKQEVVINLPFFKQGVNQWEADAISALYMDRVLRSFVRIELVLKPNWVLPILPGDRFRVRTSTQPRMDMVVEVYDVNKTLGGTGVVRAFRIQPPSKSSKFCQAKFCQAKFC